MKQQPSLIREAAHSLKFLMQHCTSDLAGQLLTSGIMPYLLEVLGSNLPGANIAFKRFLNRKKFCFQFSI